MKISSAFFLLSALSLQVQAEEYSPNPKTAFDELREVCALATPASKLDLQGTFEGRCFSSESPDSAWRFRLSSRYETSVEHYDNGPLLPPTHNVSTSFLIGTSFRGEEEVSLKDFHWSPYNEDSHPIKKLGSYLFFQSTDDNGTVTLCYTFRKL